jgi:hypothetical protein
MIESWRETASIRSDRSFGFGHAGWAYDAYPDLETLDAGRTITVAEAEGPGVIRFLNAPQIVIPDKSLGSQAKRALSARGVILEIYYDGESSPAVRVPVGDFFADGCNGRADYFTTPFVEKGPVTYNSFIPMPFEGSVRVCLRNETAYDIVCYAFVEIERLPEWDRDLGYLHATWRRWPFQLDGETAERFFTIEGEGHLLGQAWSVATDDPFFHAFWFVVEGNNEFRIDGEAEPSVNYLGSECAFGLHWGFKERYAGAFHGINLVQAEDPALVSVYRFRATGGLRFRSGLTLDVSWQNEFKSDLARTNLARYGYDPDALLPAGRDQGRGWVDYAVTTYWYQRSVGFDHEELLPLEERVKEVLHPNPR